MNEFTLIHKYLKKITKNNPSALNLNDDVLFNKKKNTVVSVDTYVEGVHFLNFNSPNLVMKKIIRSSISDLFCKGVEPKFIFIGASGNNYSFSKKNLSLISKSIKEELKKFNIKLSGGDTTKSKQTIFTIITLGYSKSIVFRNNCKNGDDIYVTGNLGDSYLGLQILKRKVSLNQKAKKYFVKKYYLPELPNKITSNLLKFANSSIDISDGLFADLLKLINETKLFFKIDLTKIPISSHMKTYLLKSKKSKINFISKGDDYQILFTSPKSKRKYIKNLFKKLNQKVSLIGNVSKKNNRNLIFYKGKLLKHALNEGYSHNFK